MMQRALTVPNYKTLRQDVLINDCGRRDGTLMCTRGNTRFLGASSILNSFDCIQSLLEENFGNL